MLPFPQQYSTHIQITSLGDVFISFLFFCVGIFIQAPVTHLWVFFDIMLLFPQQYSTHVQITSLGDLFLPFLPDEPSWFWLPVTMVHIHTFTHLNAFSLSFSPFLFRSLLPDEPSWFWVPVAMVRLCTNTHTHADLNQTSPPDS